MATVACFVAIYYKAHGAVCILGAQVLPHACYSRQLLLCSPYCCGRRARAEPGLVSTVVLVS